VTNSISLYQILSKQKVFPSVITNTNNNDDDYQWTRAHTHQRVHSFIHQFVQSKIQ